MTGETDLRVLVSQMQPALNPGRYVFASVREVPAGLQPLVLVAEHEGTTVVVEQGEADQLGLGYDYVAAWITLHVHSALAAVGLTAAVSAALADAGISCNAVAGYYHDHIFVPYELAGEALHALAGLSRSANSDAVLLDEEPRRPDILEG